MPKVTGSIIVWFENIEFEDDGEMTLQDQAHGVLKSQSLSEGDVVGIEIDEVKE